MMTFSLASFFRQRLPLICLAACLPLHAAAMEFIPFIGPYSTHIVFDGRPVLNQCEGNWSALRWEVNGPSNSGPQGSLTVGEFNLRRHENAAPGFYSFDAFYTCAPTGQEYPSQGASFTRGPGFELQFRPLFSEGITGPGIADSDPTFSVMVIDTRLGPWAPDNGVGLSAAPLSISGMKITRIGASLKMGAREDSPIAADNCIFSGVIEVESGNLSFTDCEFENLHFPELGDIDIGGVVSLRGCTFRNPPVLDNDQAVEFVDCKFLSEPAVSISHPRDKRFVRCLFADRMIVESWATTGAISGFHVEGCSFVGQTAASVSGGGISIANRAALSNCFFGDNAPQGAYIPQNFLGPRGAYIDSSWFEAPNPVAKGKFVTDRQKLPRVWMLGWIMGQNSIGHSGGAGETTMMRSRESLISVDLASAVERLDNVVVVAQVDGTDYRSAPTTIRRSVSKSDRPSEGRTTANIIIPPLNTTSAWVNVQLFLDLSGVTGYEETGGRTALMPSASAVTFEPPYARKLNVEVYPIRVYLTEAGKPSFIKSANAALVADYGIRAAFPAMLPLASSDMNVTVRPMQTVAGPLSWVGSSSLLNGVTGVLAYKEYLGDVIRSPGNGEVDFVVAVMPDGAMGSGTDGAVQSFRNGLIFVDQNKPTAVIHELGHVFGLYLAMEQYNFPQYWSTGTPVRGHTGFIPEAGTATGIFTGKRWLHYTKEEVSFHEETYTYDVMSAVAQVWPIRSSETAFVTGLRGWLGTASAARADTRVAPPVEPLAATEKKLFFCAVAQKVAGTDSTYLFEPATIKTFDATPFPNDLGRNNTGPYTTTFRWYADSPAGANRYVADLPVGLATWDSSLQKYVYADSFPVAVTMRYPADATRLRLKNVGTGQVVVELAAAPIAPAAFTSPVPGSILGDTVNVAWNAPAKLDSGGQTIQHLVLWSPDGVRWEPVAAPAEESELQLSSGFLPVGDAIRLRLVSSNGMSSAEATPVEGLSMENRPPSISIVRPLIDDRALPDTAWTLSALASDIEDGTITNVTWTSSASGLLGSGASIVALLPTGPQTLTARATDSAGAFSESTVAVTVGAMPSIDLALSEADLEITPPGRDPSNTLPPTFDPNTTGSLALHVRNQGCDTTATLNLVAIPPGDSPPRPLGSQTIRLSPFGESRLRVPFVPDTPGMWIIEGAVTSTDPHDSDPSNNTVRRSLSVTGAGEDQWLFF